MTKQTIKSILNITIHKYDNQIQSIKGSIIDSLQKQVNFEFEVQNNFKVVPIGLQVIVANDIKNQIQQLREIHQQSLGDLSITYDVQYKQTRQNTIRAYRRNQVL